MKRALVNTLISGLFFASSCGLSTHQSKGSMAIQIQWPQQGFQIQEIPQETQSIKIDVTGEGLQAPETRTIDRSSGAQQRIVFNLPIGAKQINTTALGQNNLVLAAAAQAVVIEGGKQTTAVLEMKRVRQSIFDPLPDGTVLAPIVPNSTIPLNTTTNPSNLNQNVALPAQNNINPTPGTNPVLTPPTNSTTTNPLPATSTSASTNTAPVNISSISPSSGVPGDTVTISGSGFSSNAVENVVLFGSSLAIVKSASPSQLSVTVPGKTGTFDVKVLFGASISNTLSFVISGANNKAPVIDTLTANPPTISGLGYPIELTASASDEDSTINSGNYKWICKDPNGNNCGSFNLTSGKKVVWTAPTSGTGPYRLTVEVTDNIDTVTKTLELSASSFTANVTFSGGHK